MLTPPCNNREGEGEIFSPISISCNSRLLLSSADGQMYQDVIFPRHTTFKLRPVIPIFERNEMTEFLRKPRQPTSIGIIWHIRPLFHAVSTQYLVSVFFRLCASSRFFSKDTVNSMKRTLFFEYLICSKWSCLIICLFNWPKWTFLKRLNFLIDDHSSQV